MEVYVRTPAAGVASKSVVTVRLLLETEEEGDQVLGEVAIDLGAELGKPSLDLSIAGMFYRSAHSPAWCRLGRRGRATAGA